MDGNSERIEHAVIVHIAVIHVDDFGGHLAGRRICIECGKDMRIGRIRIDRVRLLGRCERPLLGYSELELDFMRQRNPGSVRDDFRVEAEAAILIEEPLREAMARFGSGNVRFAGEMAKIAFRARGIGNGLEFLLERELVGDAAGRETVESGVVLNARNHGGRKQRKPRQKASNAHASQEAAQMRPTIRGVILP